MNKLIASLILCFGLALSARAQIKALSYNTTNGSVIGTGLTNALTFSNSLAFSTSTAQDQTRANLGLGTNAYVQIANLFITNETAGSTTNYLIALGAVDTGFTGVGGPPGSVGFRSAGATVWYTYSGILALPAGAIVQSALQFNYGAGSQGVISFGGNDPAGGASISRTNLGLGANWLTNTNVTNFRTAIGLGQSDQPIFDRVYLGGSTNTYISSAGLTYGGNGMSGGVSFGIISGQGVQNITLGRHDNQFIISSNSLFFDGSQSWGTNAQNLATTRTNLGLGATWLTNTNSPPFTVSVPAATNSTGSVGQIAISSKYIYICVDTNQWRRIQLGTW